MKKKSHLTDEDRALWKHATSVVEPHKRTEKHQKKRKFKTDEEPVAAPVKRVAAPLQKTKWKSLTHEPVVKPAVKKTAIELPSVAADVFSNIKSKKRKIDARLDLHGLTQETAHRKATAFIAQSHARHLKTVLIITGKGNNAVAVAPLGAEQSRSNKPEGVLQKNLSRWLSAHHESAKHIAGINEAPRELGGAGAFIITLKKH